MDLHRIDAPGYTHLLAEVLDPGEALALVPRIREPLPQGQLVRRKYRPIASHHPMAVGIQAGEGAGKRGERPGRRARAVLEKDRFRSQRIQGRGLHERVPVAAQIVGSHGVQGDQKNGDPTQCRGLARAAGRQGEHHSQAQEQGQTPKGPNSVALQAFPHGRASIGQSEQRIFLAPRIRSSRLGM